MKIIIKGGSVPGDAAELREVDVLIEKGRISLLAADIAVPSDADIVDAKGGLVLPGLVNAHTHAHGNLLRGVAHKWSLEELLNYGPALNLGRTIEDHYLSAAIGCIEMVRSGCTTAYDMFMAWPFVDDDIVAAVVQAYADVGMRAVLSPTIADRSFYSTIPGLWDLLPERLQKSISSMRPAPADELLRMTERAVERWHGSFGGRIRIAVGPYIPEQCTDELLSGCEAISRQYGIGVHTHLAEAWVQTDYARRRWGRPLVEHLDAMGLLGPTFLGAHGVWLSQDDISRLAQRGAMVSHNPASNMRLGSGMAPVRMMLDHGLDVALGTDGSLTSDNQNMFEAMRLAGLVSGVWRPYAQETMLSASEVWHMATDTGARMFGAEPQIGIVRIGSKADLMILGIDSPYLTPMNDWQNSLVYAENGLSVQSVLVDGRLVLHKGRLITVDESRLRERAREAAERLKHGNEEQWALADKIRPYLRSACNELVPTLMPTERFIGPPL